MEKERYGVKFRVSIDSQYPEWPSGKSVSSEMLSDGCVRHSLQDGRKVTVSEPTYLLDYISTFVDAKEGETYQVNISIAGLSQVQGFYEAWNFDIGEFRSYLFRKTVRITHLTTGETFTGAELEAQLKR